MSLRGEQQAGRGRVVGTSTGNGFAAGSRAGGQPAARVERKGQIREQARPLAAEEATASLHRWLELPYDDLEAGYRIGEISLPREWQTLVFP